MIENLAQLLETGIYSLNFNFLDVIILLVIFFYAVEGYSFGFIAALFDFTSFVISFILGLKFYGFFATILIDNFSTPKGFANAGGFFVSAFLIEIILNLLFRKVHRQFFSKENKSLEGFKGVDRVFGVLPGVASAVVLIAFLLTIIISLPFSAVLKNAVFSSRIGSVFVSNTAGFEKKLNDVFGGAVNDTLNFLTIKPQSNEFVKLNFKTFNFSVDSTAELKMFNLVNKERTLRGLSPLIYDEKLRNVARAHSEDMFKRGYFSHYTPDGLSPFDRMAKADVSFEFAGENLALAPNTDIAMQGLMNSPGHRANILSLDFGKIGIGVIDGGIYGEMFSQEFTN